MTSRAKLINIDIEATQNGLFRATSMDMPAIHAVGATSEKLRATVKQMVEDLFAANGQTVSVLEVEGAEGFSSPLVVVPGSVV